jgi:hypothetical protein
MMHNRYTDTEKDQIILKIVCGELLLEEASKKYSVSTVSLIKWLKARQVLVDTYFKRVKDGR